MCVLCTVKNYLFMCIGGCEFFPIQLLYELVRWIRGFYAVVVDRALKSLYTGSVLSQFVCVGIGVTICKGLGSVVNDI